VHATRLVKARTHNLKDVSLELREGELVCITGVSGAGKSSLALDTLYAEGQRRFVESFSPYARQFLERLERPPMEGLEPVAAGIAVDRRAPVKSARSTVATLADAEAWFSALFTREAIPTCDACGKPAEWTTPSDAAARALSAHPGRKAVLVFPRPMADVAQFLEARAGLLKDGFHRLWVQEEVRPLEGLRPAEAMGAAGRAEVVVDRVVLQAPGRGRLVQGLETAWEHGGGEATLHVLADGETAAAVLPLRRGLACPGCARAFEPAPTGLFSYQSPVGACPTCRGFGRTLGIDWDKVVPDPSKTLSGGAVRPWSGASTTWERELLRDFCRRRRIPMDVPWGKLPDSARAAVIEGEGDWEDDGHVFPGIRRWFKWLEGRTYKMHVRVLLSRYRASTPCVDCGGARMNARARSYRVGGLDLGAWHGLEVAEAAARLRTLSAGGQGELARRELLSRLEYLERVGLGYLALDRPARTLSGGEAQRVSLTAALGSSLSGALFVLDEPTVGLHPSDVPPLAQAMRELTARGNIVLVVEQDPQVIAAADRVVELGPGAGHHGGRVCFDGSPAALAKRQDLPTGKLLSGSPHAPRTRRAGRGALKVKNARTHNLAGLSVELPLGVLCVVTGPSGSGKSTLTEEVVYRTLARRRGVKDVEPPGPVDAVEGDEGLDEVVHVDQSPLGRTSRGNAATYVKAWDRFRERFAAEPDAAVRGFTSATFSFNVEGGRCEACSGEGAETVEMQFLADVALTCPSCRGRRFKDEVLAVRHRGLSVSDVLGLTVDQALAQFTDDAALQRVLGPVAALGLGYLPLGQPLSTLSGGEAQRMKLARALSAAEPGKTLFILDEPSAGLHDADVEKVMVALHGLVEAGASVLLVDHDLTVMRGADVLVDLGPGGGRQGGRLIAQGTPEQVAAGEGATAAALRSGLQLSTGAARGKSAPARAIEVSHAREHNLRDISTSLPLGKLVVFTGPSGSGKSTLAFDVVFAEGQRRFLETLSPYARQFLPALPRPDVDRVTGIPPAVALEQRTTRAGGTSTVATVTEVSHYLRLLYARVGVPHCPRDGTAITALSPDALFARLQALPGKRQLLAPAVRSRKGTWLEVFNQASRAGHARARVDGEWVETDNPPRLQKTKEHDIDVLLYEGPLKALPRALFDRALLWGEGALKVRQGEDEELHSAARSCPACGFSVPELDPRWFSFNTKQGRCGACEGTGVEGGPTAVAEGHSAPCDTCDGSRLAPIPRAVKLKGHAWAGLAQRSVSAALAEVKRWTFHGDEALLADTARTELLRRLGFLERVGLGYLSLDRGAATLSGGEMQRLRLSAQLGAGLTGALYVLDEPTIGLHPRDTARLLENLRALVDTGSSVFVVEHDTDTLKAADHLVDLGPTGGRGGGRIVAEGTPAKVLAHPDSPTGAALRAGEWEPGPSRGKPEKWLELTGATAHNLEDVDLRLPLGRMTVVAGVSGSGKSTLVRQVLYPAARRALERTGPAPLPFKSLEGLGSVQRVLAVDQSPIGRTPRSVPATFLGIWDELRKAFAQAPEARARGYTAARFSFNSPRSGRCTTCEGQGSISHEMSFLPDVVTPCAACGGARFDAATLEVRYRGLNIGEVLRLSADEAREVFSAWPKVAAPLACLSELGVGYLQLGQPSNTLSGGEAQRLKLAAELTATTRHVHTLYVLDEPTTGLHVGDVRKLVRFLHRLVDRGDTLVVIEHHPAVMAASDWLVELGPEGGEAGGRIVAEGTPEAVAKKKTATGRVLAAVRAGR
jgi:excinuclease ABC subunit A